MINEVILSIALLASLSLINGAEAWLEAVVIQLKNGSLPDYKDLNRKEHARSFIYSSLVALPFFLVFISWGFYWLLPAVAVNRRLIFDPLLKALRKRRLSLYEGDGPIDGALSRIFGRRGAWIEILLELAGSLACLYLQYF